MFNNLIESSSHRGEFRRRGSFFLFTTASYALLFVIAGVVSIYAYDARMEDQSLEISILSFNQPDLVSEPARTPERTPRESASRNPTAGVVRPTRPILIDSTNNPNNVPDKVGVIAPPFPPAPSNAVVGNLVLDPPSSGVSGSGGDSGSNRNSDFVNNIQPPPPAPTPTPVPKIVRSPTVLNSRALSLPKPPYPPIARQARVQGLVSVQVLLDETGKVISAKVVSGHPLLVPEALRAAYQARFSPTMLGEQAVKVSGLITYNFVLQ